MCAMENVEHFNAISQRTIENDIVLVFGDREKPDTFVTRVFGLPLGAHSGHRRQQRIDPLCLCKKSPGSCRSISPDSESNFLQFLPGARTLKNLCHVAAVVWYGPGA